MPYTLTMLARHADTSAAAGFLHSGIHFALTEFAYVALAAQY